jgi:agmatine deiminase
VRQCDDAPDNATSDGAVDSAVSRTSPTNTRAAAQAPPSVHPRTAAPAHSRTDRPFRMPAEWEPHRATWISWPHHEPDWPGKLGPISWVYAEIARVLAGHETVEILCHSLDVMEGARLALEAHGVAKDRVVLHEVPTDRVWLRDSAPTGVFDAAGRVVLLDWAFSGWAKYPNWHLDVDVGPAMAQITSLPREEPCRVDTGNRVVLEGGGIDVNGQGLLLATEEWLLTDVQVRNPGLGREDYERLFREWLGIRRTIWLGEGCVGDDTHGHIDDVARFVNADTVVVAVEEDPLDDNHSRSIDNLRRLEAASNKIDVGRLRIVKLPFPRPVTMNGERLPASYANFYVANGVVLVPTFNDPNDRVALNTLAELMPTRRIVGIHAVDLVWGLGTIHCLTQQEPAPQSATVR